MEIYIEQKNDFGLAMTQFGNCAMAYKWGKASS